MGRRRASGTGKPRIRSVGALVTMAAALTLAPTASSSDVTATITPGGPSVTVTTTAAPSATVSTTAARQNAATTFSGTAGQRVFVNLTGVSIGSSSCCSLLASILKPDGSTMSGTTKYVGTSGGYLDTVTLPSSGTYTVFLDPQGTATGSATVTTYDEVARAAACSQVTQNARTPTSSSTVPGQ